MAIKKEVLTDFGITADYWRLDSVVYNKKDSTVSATFNLYACSGSAYLAKIPLKSLSFTCNAESAKEDLRVICYTKAKELILPDGEDC